MAEVKRKVILRADPAQVTLLLAWLREKNVTGAYIAQELKITEATVSRWYTEKFKPHLTIAQFNTLKELARTIRDGYKTHDVGLG